MNIPLIAVVGPTGSGKSDLALTIAETFHGEIVNCDSVQLYRYLNIGTAKTPVSERRGLPHHLLDILNPDQIFTAGDYARAARDVIGDIASRSRIPVLAGGTGFYLRALLQGLSEAPPRDVGLRERLAKRASSSLHRLLRRLDPASAQRIHPNDAQKMIRALEVSIVARKPMSEVLRTGMSHPLQGFRVFKIGTDPARDILARRIADRTDRMFRAGLLDEVQQILSLGYAPDARALQSIGYREAVLCLNGQLTMAEAIELTTTATRQYAKRQRTWFRREPDLFQVPATGDQPAAQKIVLQHLSAQIDLSSKRL